LHREIRMLWQENAHSAALELLCGCLTLELELLYFTKVHLDPSAVYLVCDYLGPSPDLVWYDVHILKHKRYTVESRSIEGTTTQQQYQVIGSYTIIPVVKTEVRQASKAYATRLLKPVSQN